MIGSVKEKVQLPQEVVERYEPFTAADMLRIQEQLETLFPMEMNLLRMAGVHPTDNTLRVNPYTGEMDNELYNNVGQHCMAVGYACSLIAGTLFTEGQKEHKVVQGFIHEATSHGITHNLSKGMEIMRKKAVKAGKFSIDPYSVSAYEMVGQVLAQSGGDYPPEFVEYMKNSGSETGHNSLASFLTLTDSQAKLVEGRMADKIVHVADDITWTAKAAVDGMAPTFYLPVRQRMAAQDFPHTYPFLYKEGIAFNVSGKPVVVKDAAEAAANPDLRLARTYAEWQVWEAEEMSRELVAKVPGAGTTEDPHQRLVDLLNDKMRERHNYFPHIRISVTP